MKKNKSKFTDVVASRDDLIQLLKEIYMSSSQLSDQVIKKLEKYNIVGK